MKIVTRFLKNLYKKCARQASCAKKSQVVLLCQVFFHGAGQFQYYTEQETMPNSFRIDFLTLKVAEHAGLRYKIDYD